MCTEYIGYFYFVLIFAVAMEQRFYCFFQYTICAWRKAFIEYRLTTLTSKRCGHLHDIVCSERRKSANKKTPCKFKTVSFLHMV